MPTDEILRVELLKHIANYFFFLGYKKIKNKNVVMLGKIIEIQVKVCLCEFMNIIINGIGSHISK